MKINKLLIVVDYQVDFVDGSLGFARAKQLEAGILNRIKEYELNNQDIIFTLDTHDANYLTTNEGINLPVEHCLINTKGHQVYGKVYDYSLRHPNIIKNTFGSKELVNYLGKKIYQEIEIVGVVTHICVLSNAIICKSVLPDAKIIINTSLCASYDVELEKQSLNIMKNLHMEII